MPVVAREAFRQAVREGAVQLLADYKADRDLKLQIYRARPASLMPPTAFVDRIRERVVFIGPSLRQRTVTAEVIVVHGLFDSGDAVDQADAFVDGFSEWCLDRLDAAGADTTIGATAIDDNPNWVPDWLPPNLQKTYYATAISLEGFATD